MRQKSESSDRCRAQWTCCEINHDTVNAEGLHESIATWRMGADMSTSSLAIGAGMPRAEWLECRYIVICNRSCHASCQGRECSKVVIALRCEDSDKWLRPVMRGI